MSTEAGLSLKEMVALAEAKILDEQILKFKTKTAMAKGLGLSRVALYKKLWKYGLMKEETSREHRVDSD